MIWKHKSAVSSVQWSLNATQISLTRSYNLHPDFITKLHTFLAVETAPRVSVYPTALDGERPFIPPYTVNQTITAIVITVT